MKSTDKVGKVYELFGISQACAEEIQNKASHTKLDTTNWIDWYEIMLAGANLQTPGEYIYFGWLFAKMYDAEQKDSILENIEKLVRE